ncbi:uncharacterized protein Z518_04742 [Rhinocladiella mackenziei CBS 650.93]|uniref:Uncharacterized protein n=1 Tax=Rhinocladiella mackenziei CBS 650.93 TaxID=1442369 RepID=A0A0D2IUC8_9EURO|nr:uncharacterized protein Z518_04742 [Rhinocladiella mackenziei CBS 650.93]KIX06766.1 hypothetical protein Z518_04742 [Rhinocladiella mackenziei CBS 650.93]
MRPDTLSLKGKIAIITGSGKENGIGAGIATALAQNGAWVVVNYVSEATDPRAANVAAKIEQDGGKVAVVQADVSTPEGAKKIIAETVKAFNAERIDVLGNNAGAGATGPAMQASDEDLKKVFGVNVFGPLYMIRAVVPLMPRGGRIVNVSSIASKMGMAVIPLYSSAKAAQDQLAYALAMELGRGNGITINTVAPGPVPTDGLPKGPVADAIHDALVPLTRAEERMGTVEDIADAVLLLVSEKSRWITGQYISTSGGMTGG